MKKLLALLLAVVMVVGLMAACNKGGTEDTKATTEATQGGSADVTEGTTEATEPLPGYMDAAHPERYGGHLNPRLAGTSGHNSLDPMNKTGIWAYHWTTLVYEPALTRDADNQIQPGLCDYTWDPATLTLTMWMASDDITFHDGSPCEITDVYATWVRASTMYSSIKTKVWPHVVSCELDGDKMVVKLDQDFENFWYYMASYQTWCAVQPKEICEKYTGDKNYNADNVADAIGTGPYKVIANEAGVSLELERYEGYVFRGEGLTGFAGPKYAYMDTITFWDNGDDSNATMALFAGDYDVVECIDSEYLALLSDNDLVETRWPSDTGCRMYFNTKSTASTVSRYPSMRKAIMAAIDYEEFLKVVTDNQQVMGGCFYLSPDLYTDEFVNQDYYGPTNMEAVNKYLEMAKQEGWDGVEPVRIYRSSSRDDIPTLYKKYLQDAGIPVEVNIMEGGAISDIKAQKETSLWDVDFDWPTYRMTPTTYTGWTYQSQPEYEALIAEMQMMDVNSDAYKEKVKELTKIHLEELGIAYMSMIDWFWYHPETLNPNDEGLTRYWFNAYWTDPENHTKK